MLELPPVFQGLSQRQALAIGVGVDYAIHYLNAYKRCLAEGAENPLNAVYRTTGSAILVNALSVAVGFLGLLISRFIPIQQLGILFSVSMVCACLASLVVLPLVVEIIKPRFLRRSIRLVPEGTKGDLF